MTMLVLAAFCLTVLPAPALAARMEQTPLDQVLVSEQILYGAEQTGSLLERTARLEKDLFGLPGKEALMAKLNRIYFYVREGSVTEPSLVFKLNSLEWSLTQSVTKGAVKDRLEGLEKTVSGIVGSGSIEARVSRLMAITFSGSKLKAGQAVFTQDSLIKIKLVTPLDSRKNKAGDPVEFVVAEDVFASGLLLISKGAVGRGKVSKVDRSGFLGRDARIEVLFENVEAMDMTPVATLLGDKAKKETESSTVAAGAGFAGLVLLGPIGVVGAVFVHGKNVTVPAGTLLYIQAQKDVELIGLVVK
jgi:hypothetical protein